MNNPHPTPSAELPDMAAALSALASGKTTACELAVSAARVADSAACEFAFVHHTPSAVASAMAQARASDARRASGQMPRPLEGLPISIKDLCDVQGQTTQAGSVALAGSPAASEDCPAVARLREAGAVLVGRTNMSEFAFSGVGYNPHFGTPANPCDAAVRRVPGGSSSGAAVTVGLGAAFAGLGSDTGGSIRIPAALCGLVGFKPTAKTVPGSGLVPLSTTLDTVGAITRSVRDAARMHAVLSASNNALAGFDPTQNLSLYRFAVADTVMQDGLQAPVEQAFERALRALHARGAHVERLPLAPLAEPARLQAKAGLSSTEGLAWHIRHGTWAKADLLDARVRVRLRAAEQTRAVDYVELLHQRQAWIARMHHLLEGFDAVLSPTVPVLAPPIAEIETDDDAFFALNAQLLRNTSLVNFLDGCALSLPIQAPGELPVGLMVWQRAAQDHVVLRASAAIEAALSAHLRR